MEDARRGGILLVFSAPPRAGFRFGAKSFQGKTKLSKKKNFFIFVDKFSNHAILFSIENETAEFENNHGVSE